MPIDKVIINASPLILLFNSDLSFYKCSASLGIQTIGTGSLLVLAKKKKIINSVEQSLIKLKNSGMWISDTVIQLLKESAGE